MGLAGRCRACPPAAHCPGFRHGIEHQLAARLREREIVRRRKARRRLHHAREHCRLRQVQIFGRAAEIMLRRRPQAVDAVAEIDARQIAREDLVLGQPGFEPEGDDHFLRLPLEAAVRRQEAGLGELLGDGRAALTDAARPHVGDHRPADPARVDAPVPVEAAILDRDEGGRSHRVELADVDRRFLDRSAPGDWQAFLRDEQDGGVVEWLQRSRQGRGHDQPDQGDEQDSGNRVEHQRPTTRAGVSRFAREPGPIRAVGRRARTDRAVPPGWSRPGSRSPHCRPTRVPELPKTGDLLQ